MPTLTIAGLGPGHIDQLPLGTFRQMKEHPCIWLRTHQHPMVESLVAEGIKFDSFDDLYDRLDSFEAVYETIAETLLEMAEKKDVFYGVPGHPNVAEESVRLLVEKGESNGAVQLEILPAMSFLDVMFPLLPNDPVEGFQLLDGLRLEQTPPDTNMDVMITQVYDQMIASQVKISLMNHYHDEQLITVIQRAGMLENQKVHLIPLYELDHLKDFDELTSIYIARVDRFSKIHYNMNHLLDILEKLRGVDGCPWDKEQTHESLRPYLVEESQEVLDAIDGGNDEDLCEELGDLLLQVVFHSQLAKERNAFVMSDVINGIAQKIVYRHPHVFGDEKANSIEDVKKIWDHRKAEEKKG
ncbi:MazG nucleotide pyrophosphohydrolase domain-containing protein [Tindallia californiensis]|uniref:Tetrapyrrole methylase family protein / MazG family protein n=1 Tax=Tindallia californiensis TaxID=159292 RepID=A0A1H3PGT3_9FIRM|nr:MazG nucleotide pyrophosphohydrolase domain-containing protein [Tindallia californiensis]SDZ00035.1 tetrapyrrole methylase family protein / MazG family protein [Tindallia californiensis]